MESDALVFGESFLSPSVIISFKEVKENKMHRVPFIPPSYRRGSKGGKGGGTLSLSVSREGQMKVVYFSPPFPFLRGMREEARVRAIRR